MPGAGPETAGIAFDVYEQDAAPDSRTQGYRIRIDRTGQAALADSLPPAQYQLFLQTCSRSQSAGQFLDQAVAGRGPPIRHLERYGRR